MVIIAFFDNRVIAPALCWWRVLRGFVQSGLRHEPLTAWMGDGHLPACAISVYSFFTRRSLSEPRVVCVPYSPVSHRVVPIGKGGRG